MKLKMTFFCILVAFSLSHAMNLSLLNSFYGERPVLLKDGVGYYYEKTRLLTQEEIKKRLEWFEEEWSKLEEKEKELQKSLSEAEKETLKTKKKSVQPPGFEKFISTSFKLFGLIVKEGMGIGKSLAKEYLSRAPVVTEAGFVIKKYDGTSYTLKVDYEKLYPEEWKRMPSEGVFVTSSLNGLYVALMTETEPGIRFFKVDEGRLEPILHLPGKTPIALSPSGRYIAYRSLDDQSIVVANQKGEVVYKVFLKYRVGREKEQLGPVRIALTEKHLAIISWIGIKLVNLENGAENEVRLDGGKSIIFNLRGDRIYATSVGGALYIYDVDNLKLIKRLNPFHLWERHKVRFLYLASVSPDDRLIAGLYDPSSVENKAPAGTSVLFIYDLQADKILLKMEALESITGGFGGVFVPASFSPDWDYLLVYKRGSKIELFRIQREVSYER